MKHIMVVLAIALATIVGFTGCGFLADEDQAVRAATNLGFTEVKVESRAVFLLNWRGCSKSDDAGFTVTGKNPQGQRVKLLVCVGWPFKGATVRSM
jgi:hypothetical protein